MKKQSHRKDNNIICKMLLFVLVLIVCFTKYVSWDLSQVYFVILSQSHPYHADIGSETKAKLEKSLKQNGVDQERNSRNLLSQIRKVFIDFHLFFMKHFSVVHYLTLSSL